MCGLSTCIITHGGYAGHLHKQQFTVKKKKGHKWPLAAYAKSHIQYYRLASLLRIEFLLKQASLELPLQNSPLCIGERCLENGVEEQI